MALRTLMRSRQPGALLVVFASLSYALAQTPAGSFTLQQVMSAPFTSDLIAAPAKNRVAWVADSEGRHNLWVAEPGAQGWTSRQLTHYTMDDGLGVNTPQWTADAEAIVYELGGSSDDEAKPAPNPAWLVKGVTQQIWVVPLAGGEPRLIGEGHRPAVSPDGKTVAFVRDREIWTARLDAAPIDAPGAKPEQLLVTRGDASELTWSPDGKKLAFKSDRDDHSFIAVFDFDRQAVMYLDPSTDEDQNPNWSPDSKMVAFVRVPTQTDYFDAFPQRTGEPWSIHVADAVTGEGRAMWRADQGPGSVFHSTESDVQLLWVAGNRIVFPWEKDGWLHLYAIGEAGGTPVLLTPGEFEVDHTAVAPKGDAIVFDSNQDDIDRRHVWRIGFAANGTATASQQLTSGTGIETKPVVTSDDETVVVLRSDAMVPIRAAVVQAGTLVDLAPQAIPADFPRALLVTPQQVVFSAADGLTIHGQLFVPPNAKPDERLPAIVFFHGGSKRQMLLGWHYSGYYSNAYAMNQYLASRGYIVLSVNYRSGIGYGLNFREALNFGTDGASEFNDVLGAGLYLRSRSDVDPARIGCWGGSYGGYLTALALARASSLYAAGVDFHGVHNWLLEFPTFSPGLDPQKLADFERKAFESSPMASISTWRSPVLLIQGDDDRDVAFSETVQLAEALRKQKVHFEELIFPDEIHAFLLHRDWLRAYAAEADFFDRKLKAAQR